MPKMHGKKQIKSECDFVKAENNILCYRCKECKTKKQKNAASQ